MKFKTGSPGVKKLGHQAKSKENLVNTLEITFSEVIIMNLAQDVCLDDL